MEQTPQARMASPSEHMPVPGLLPSLPIAGAERQEAATCPFHHQVAQRRSLTHGDELVLPLNKRIIKHYTSDAYGTRELHLYYGDKEISFDEPELFAFGETLALQSRFAAGSAMQWGGPHEWIRVQGLLEQLIDEGVLRHAGPQDAPEHRQRPDGARPSPLPPAPASTPHHWGDSAAITQTLTGRSLDPAWLEVVIPVFRVAHIAVDGEGRQVGEANVFPKALRMEVPTRWRTCIYPGSRHQSERPMNVTALKTMRAHWAQMMAILLRVREAYLQRFPEARQGWTVGHLERLAVAVLALPTHTLVRADKPLGNGEMHPALSCLFRVTDGLRMTMHQMLFVPVAEPTLSPVAPVSSSEILAYAERNHSFHSEHGVCAGPNAMIEEFLHTLVDGKAPAAAPVPLDRDIEEALAHLDEAMDYGFHGLRSHAAMFSLWPVMTRSYEQLASIAADWSPPRSDARHGDSPHGDSPDGAPPHGDALHNEATRRFRERMQELLAKLRQATFLGEEAWRADRETVYADMFARCGEGLRLPGPTATLGSLLAPVHTAEDETSALRLQALLERHFAPGDPAGRRSVQDLCACLMDFFVRTRAVISLACKVQLELNHALQRPAPLRPLTAAELNIHNLLQGADMRGLPYLIDEIAGQFNLAIDIDAQQLSIREAHRHAQG